MKKVITTLVLAAMLLIASCKSGNNTDVTASDSFDMHTLNSDTTCMLFSGRQPENAPHCMLSYSIQYAEGKDADFINKILAQNIFPNSYDSTSFSESMHNDIKDVVERYYKTLKGITRKSISDGSFPKHMATYERSIKGTGSVIKDKIMAYSVLLQEKAFGSADTLTNEFTYNISLTEHRILTTDDIFVKGHKDRLSEKIVNTLAKTFNTQGLKGLQEKGIFADGMAYASDNFILEDDAITFVYNSSEIAGRKYGLIKVTIPAKDLTDIMVKEWIALFEKK